MVSYRAVFLLGLDPQETPADREKTCILLQTCTCTPMPLISRPLLPLVYACFLGGLGGNPRVPSSRGLFLLACSACFCSTLFRMGTPEPTKGSCGLAGPSGIYLGILWPFCSHTSGFSVKLLGTLNTDKSNPFSCCAAFLTCS